MPQVQLPIFPAGSVEINRDLACRREGEQVVYYNGHLPVFTHAQSDLASFRMFTSQLIVQGSATQGQVTKAFGVPLVAISQAPMGYHKYPEELWPVSEFNPHSVRLVSGEVVERELAQRGTRLSNGLWLREVRVRNPDGSQCSMLSTHRGLDLVKIAAWLPARWS